MNSRAIPGIITGATIALAATFTYGNTAFAHNGGITASCKNGQPTIVADLTNYSPTNTITIRVDGGPELTPGTFGSSYQHTFTSVGTPFTTHTVTYAVKAHDDAGHPEYSPHGTISIPACQTTPTTTTTTAPAATTTTPPPTTTAAPTTTTAATTGTSTVVVGTVLAPPLTGPATTIGGIDTAQVATTAATTTVTAEIGTPPAFTDLPPVVLPATGDGTGRIAEVALGIVLVGWLIVGCIRPKTRS